MKPNQNFHGRWGDQTKKSFGGRGMEFYFCVSLGMYVLH